MSFDLQVKLTCEQLRCLARILLEPLACAIWNQRENSRQFQRAVPSTSRKRKTWSRGYSCYSFGRTSRPDQLEFFSSNRWRQSSGPWSGFGWSAWNTQSGSPGKTLCRWWGQAWTGPPRGMPKVWIRLNFVTPLFTVVFDTVLAISASNLLP